MIFLRNKHFINESELRLLTKVLLENKFTGSQIIKVNPVVDQSAAITDPSNPDYKPNSKQELQVALTAMVNNSSDDKVSNIYDVLKQAFQSQEQEEDKPDSGHNINELNGPPASLCLQLQLTSSLPRIRFL